MTEARPQERIDAVNLVLHGQELDLEAVRGSLSLISARGYARDQDLLQKLAAIMAAAAAARR